MDKRLKLRDIRGRMLRSPRNPLGPVPSKDPIREGTLSMAGTRFRRKSGIVTWDKKEGSLGIDEYVRKLYPRSAKENNLLHEFRDLLPHELAHYDAINKGKHMHKLGKKNPFAKDKDAAVQKMRADQVEAWRRAVMLRDAFLDGGGTIDYVDSCDEHLGEMTQSEDFEESQRVQRSSTSEESRPGLKRRPTLEGTRPDLRRIPSDVEMFHPSHEEARLIFEPTHPRPREVPFVSVANRPSLQAGPGLETRPHPEARPHFETRPSLEGRPRLEARPHHETRPHLESRRHLGTRPGLKARPAIQTQPATETRPNPETSPDLEEVCFEPEETHASLEGTRPATPSPTLAQPRLELSAPDTAHPQFHDPPTTRSVAATRTVMFERLPSPKSPTRRSSRSATPKARAGGPKAYSGTGEYAFAPASDTDDWIENMVMISPYLYRRIRKAAGIDDEEGRPDRVNTSERKNSSK